MTAEATTMRCTLTIPRHFAACFATPEDVRAYIIEQHMWPAGVQEERWRFEAKEYVVDLVLTVPYPRRRAWTRRVWRKPGEETLSP